MFMDCSSFKVCCVPGQFWHFHFHLRADGQSVPQVRSHGSFYHRSHSSDVVSLLEVSKK